MGKPVQGMQGIWLRYIEVWNIKYPQSTNNLLVV